MRWDPRTAGTLCIAVPDEQGSNAETRFARLKTGTEEMQGPAPKGWLL
jgi:hypothetical protein